MAYTRLIPTPACDQCGTTARWEVFDDAGVTQGVYCAIHAELKMKEIGKQCTT